MKSILFIIPKNDVGGAPKFVIEQINVCHEAGYKCYVATNLQGWIDRSCSQKIEGMLLDKKIESLFSISFFVSLCKFIKLHKINLVICNSANGGLFGRLAAFAMHIPSVYITHGWSSIYNGGKMAILLNFIERLLSYIGSKIICVSQMDFQKSIEIIGTPFSKNIQINNAISPVYTVRESNIPSQKIKLLAIIRFRAPKRVDLLIKAMKSLPNIELHVYGSGPQESELRHLIKDLDLNNVSIYDEVENFNLFHLYDIFILISDSEGLPMSAIEAMSAGMPLILSNVGGCPELIKNNGYLVENNEHSISSAVLKTIENYSELAQNSKSFFDSSFNMNNTKNEYLNLYSELINANAN